MAKTETPETDEHESATPKAGAVMGTLFLVFFLATSDQFALSPLLPLVASELGLSEGSLGALLFPAYALAAAAAALLVGPISDIYGRRRFLLYATLLFGSSLLLIALFKNAYLLIAMRVLTGLAAGTFSTCSIAYVADYFPYKRRGAAMSLVQAGYFAALVLGVPAVSFIAKWQQGYGPGFMFLALLSAVALFMVLWMLPEDKHLMAEDISERVARRFERIRLVAANRERIAAVVAAFLVSAGFVGFFSYLGAWMKDELKLDTDARGLFFIIVGVAALVGALVGGRVADKLGKRSVSIFSTIILAAMLFVIPRVGWGVALFVTFLTASLAFAFRQGPLQALATQLVPRRVQGAFVSVRNTASQIGIAVSTAVSGQLYDSPSMGYAAVGIFSGLVTLAAAIFIFMIKEPHAESHSNS
ncbi:MAG TPA: MFS transporter [Blastocatellia bacterium]|nr:MFS transporter [Blastocatellia bacterium]